MRAKNPPVSVPEVELAPVVAELIAVKSSPKAKSRSDLYNSIVRALVYATAFVLPLFYLPLTSGVLEHNKQMLLVVVASVGLLVWLLGVVINGRLTVRWTSLDKGILGILLATVVTGIASLARSQSIFGSSNHLSSSLMSVIALSVFYFLAVNTIHDRGRILRHVISLSVLLTLALGLCQMFALHILPGVFANSRAFNTVGSLNALGLLAAICLPLFAKMTSRRGLSLPMVAGVLGIIVSVALLGILNWWVLWTVALAGMLAMIAFDSLNSARFALSRFFVPMVIIVIGAFLLIVNFSVTSLKSQFPVEVGPSYPLSWHVLKGAARQHPVVGYGPENFMFAFDTFAAKDLSQTQFSSVGFTEATSEFMNTLVEGGILALLAGLFLGWSLFQVIRRFVTMPSESVSSTGGTFAALIAGTVALFLYPFSLTAFFLWYVLLSLAALAVSSDRARTLDIQERPRYSLVASLSFIVGLIIVLTGLYFSAIRYSADVRYANAMSRSVPTERLQGLTRTLSLHSGNAQYLRDASQASLFVLRDELNATKDSADSDRPARIQQLIASAVQLAQQATVVQPLESMNWNNLGIVYQSMTGLVDNVEILAEEAFKKAGSLRPGDPQFDNRIGSMWLARAELIRQVARSSTSDTAKLNTQMNESLQNAADAFKRAIETSPNFGLAIYNLGAVYDRQGKVGDAIKQLEKIAPYNANDPTLMFELGLLYIRAGRKDAALTVMQRSVLLAPQYANARWYVALLLEEKGDIESALTHLRELQKTNADNQVLAEKIDQLEAGQRSIPPAKVIDSKPLQ